MNKPDHYLETEHLQMLIDNTQNGNLWEELGNIYGFRNGTVDDRTGEIWCVARPDYDRMLLTYKSNGKK